MRQFPGPRDWDWVLIGVYNGKRNIRPSPMKKMSKRTVKNSNCVQALIVW